MAELNRRKSELLVPLQEAENLVKQLEEFGADLTRAEGEISALMTCPVCGAPGEFEHRDQDCFETRCSSDGCETVWGLRTHPPSSGRIPYLVPGGISTTKWPRVAQPQWVDDILGCDVLAVPAVEEDDTVLFRPPRKTPTDEKIASALQSDRVSSVHPIDVERDLPLLKHWKFRARIIGFAASFCSTGPGPVFRDYQGLCRPFGTAIVFQKIGKTH